MTRYLSAGREEPVAAVWRRRQAQLARFAIAWAVLGVVDGLIWGVVLAAALHLGGG